MRKWAYLVVPCIIVIAAVAFADTITKGLIGKEDVYWQVTDGGASETYTRAASTGATLTLTRVNGSQIPWDNTYTRTIRPKTITGNSTGNISGYDNITATSKVQGATLTVTGASTLTGAVTASSTMAVTGAMTLGTSVTSPAATITALTYTSASGTTLTNTGQFIHNSVQREVGSAAPTTGTYATGAIVTNSAVGDFNAIADKPLYWVCVSGGTPGTWRAVYPLWRVGPASASALGKPGMMAYDNTYLYINSPTTDNSWKRVTLATW